MSKVLDARAQARRRARASAARLRKRRVEFLVFTLKRDLSMLAGNKFDNSDG
jgi:hypothetical protein